MTNINAETEKPLDDLDGFEPGPPRHRLDDKAAVLEKEVQSLKSGFNRERFLYYFVIQCLFLALIGIYAPPKVFGFMIVASLLFSIGLSKFLDFPWIGEHLERWHDACFDACNTHIFRNKPKEIKTEPLENGDQN